jgi:very-short-patch-repair endonuclease
MGTDIHVFPVFQGKRDTHLDRAVAGLAARQHGVIARHQLASLGLGCGAIDHRVARGALHRIHRGVFAVGHALLSRDGRFMAAVLAAGPGAVLSHLAAAILWRIRDGSPPRVDVTVPANRRARAELTIHRGTLAADEVTVHRGIAVTNPARTLLDLAEQLRPHQLERAVHEAEYLRLTSPLSLDDLLTRHRGRSGTAALRVIVDRGRLGQDRTRNDFEAAFLRLLDRHGLPRPRTNEHVAGHEVDAVWPYAKLIVELDGRQAHQTTRAFKADRARDRDPQTRGYRVLRITSRQLDEGGRGIAAQLGPLLNPGRSGSPSRWTIR